MKLTANTRILELIERYDFLVDCLAAYNSRYELLKNRVARSTLARFATLSRVAAMGQVPLRELQQTIAGEIMRRTGEAVVIEGVEDDEPESDDADKVERLKQILIDLHAGRDADELKQEFAQLLTEIDPNQIVELEQAIIRDGVPAGEIQELCDLHTAVFKGALDDQDLPDVPPGHPVDHYLQENRVLESIVEELQTQLQDRACGELPETVKRLQKLEIHYQRKENQLFPLLEKHGVTGPTQVMWGVDDDIRRAVREFAAAAAECDLDKLNELGPALFRDILEMVYKEEKILFPMAFETLSDQEWLQIAAGDREIGFAWITPREGWTDTAAATEAAATPANELNLGTGKLKLEQIDLMLRHLPVDLSFVDENDVVCYYSDVPDRIFPRSPSVIGRQVQNCHPPKSIDVVEKILRAFRAGEKDEAEFWIEMAGRFLHIRYFAMRAAAGAYRGCLEVSQDVTDIRQLTGQRRLLDWD